MVRVVESHDIMGKGKGKFSKTGDSRNKTRPAKVRVVANSKQKVFSWTHNVVKYTLKKFGCDYTLY